MLEKSNRPKCFFAPVPFNETPIILKCKAKHFIQTSILFLYSYICQSRRRWLLMKIFSSIHVASVLK